MAPSDEFQAEVILDILTHYGWTDLAIIASDSNYGIHGVTILQQLLSETTAEDSVVEEFDIEVREPIRARYLGHVLSANQGPIFPGSVDSRS